MARGVKVHGYREFVRACDRAGKDSKRLVRAQLRHVGNIVKDAAQQRFAPVDARSAAGFRTVVRTRGVAVEQRYPRTTGDHPEYGVMQMKVALLPAVEDKEPQIVGALESAVDEIADHFEGAP